MPPASDPASLLRDLSAALRHHGCRWYLFGAQAVTIWGRPRLTTDVDVTVRLESGTTEDLVATLIAAGFRLPDGFTDEFVRATRVLPLLHISSGMPLDIVLAGPGLEDEFLARAIVIAIDDFAVPVISPEDLLITKVLAGRSKDVEDIRGVLRLRAASLDLAYIRRTLTAIEAALGQSDLQPLFETELARTSASR
ncbi:MAG: nucleotidyltransferase [Acidobacteriota bacterium]|nr:nucleotidyltransferase [Acidobacteriota bacterium]